MRTISVPIDLDINIPSEVEIDIDDFMEKLSDFDLYRIKETYFDTNDDSDYGCDACKSGNFDWDIYAINGRGNSIPEYCYVPINNLDDYFKMQTLLKMFYNCSLQQIEGQYEKIK